MLARSQNAKNAYSIDNLDEVYAKRLGNLRLELNFDIQKPASITQEINAKYRKYALRGAYMLLGMVALACATIATFVSIIWQYLPW